VKVSVISEKALVCFWKVPRLFLVWSIDGMILTRGTAKFLEYNLSHCHFVPSESHIDSVQFVPRCKHSPSRFIKTDQQMLYGEIFADCSENHAKHVCTLWAECRISKGSTWWHVAGLSAENLWLATWLLGPVVSVWRGFYRTGMLRVWPWLVRGREAKKRVDCLSNTTWRRQSFLLTSHVARNGRW
jgi:hypothetical protein